MTTPTLKDPTGKVQIVTDPAQHCSLCLESLMQASPQEPARPGLVLFGKVICSSCIQALSDRLTIHIVNATVALQRRSGL